LYVMMVAVGQTVTIELTIVVVVVIVVVTLLKGARVDEEASAVVTLEERLPVRLLDREEVVDTEDVGMVVGGKIEVLTAVEGRTLELAGGTTVDREVVVELPPRT